MGSFTAHQTRPKRGAPDIWAKVYALEVAEHKRSEDALLEKQARAAVKQREHLQRQLEAETEKRTQAKLLEDNFAEFQQRQMAEWRNEEMQKKKEEAVKAAQEKRRFMTSLEDTQARKERAEVQRVRREQQEVERIKRVMAAAKKKEHEEKMAKKAENERIKLSNIEGLKRKEGERQKMIDFEKRIAAEYVAKLDKQEADRAAALNDMKSHQALLYEAGASVADQVAAENKILEDKMLAAQHEHNRQEDEKMRLRKEKEHRMNMEQMESLRKQQEGQAARRREDYLMDMKLAMRARDQDQKAAMESMVKEMHKRADNITHRRLIVRQMAQDGARKEKAREGMSDLEMKFNKSMLKKVDDFHQTQSNPLAVSGQRLVSENNIF